MQQKLPAPGNTPAERIHWARLKLNLTISEVADTSGVSRVTISHLENGRPGDITTFKMLAKVLHQPIWFLGCFESLPENTLGQRIRKARIYQGLNQKEFAKRLNINTKTVQQWENGAYLPSSKSIKTLRSYIDII